MKQPAKLFTGGILIFGLLMTGMHFFSAPSPITSSSSSSGYTVQDNAPAPSAQKVVAPNFSLQTLDGQQVSLVDYRGDKPVILDFWASWCHNCQRSFPKTAKLYDEYKDQVEIIGVNMRESKGVAQNFVDKTGASFPIGIDSGSITQQYGVRYTNTHVLIDREGHIVNSFSGDLSETHILTLISS